MAFTYKEDDQNIVTLTMDMPGRSTNVINKEYSLSLLKNVKKLEQDSELAGVIITSAKKTFLAGADIEMIYRQEDPQACFELIEAGKATMRKLELLSIPIVAAVNGTALGGGIELALCCNYRIVLNNPRAKFGFPEVTLGILPGGGGVARLPRMIGIEPSLPLLIDGKQVNASKAVEKGLMDELVSTPEEMFDRARSWIIENQECQQPWDMKGFKIPGGNAQHSIRDRTLHST